MPKTIKDYALRITELERGLYEMENQVNFVLKISRAINNHAPERELFELFEDAMINEVQVNRMVFMIKEVNEWIRVSSLNAEQFKYDQFDQLLQIYERPTVLNKKDLKLLDKFEYIIPIRINEEPYACVLIGDVATQANFFHNFSFIISVANLIVVALQNRQSVARKLERERFRNEMALASEVQRLILPQDWPQVQHIDIASVYLPFWNIGGDYIDCIMLDNNRTAFCVADVSGKGISAAIMMANFQGVLRNTISSKISLERLVLILNAAVIQVAKFEKIITFFVAEYNRKTRVLQYLNAGHTPPYLVSQNELIRLDQGTTMLGIVEELPVSAPCAIELKDDVFLTMFTDGLTDVINNKGESFDMDKLEEFILNNSKLSVNNFNEKLISVLDEYNHDNTFPDDIAILTCKIKV